MIKYTRREKRLQMGGSDIEVKYRYTGQRHARARSEWEKKMKQEAGGGGASSEIMSNVVIIKPKIHLMPTTLSSHPTRTISRIKQTLQSTPVPRTHSSST